MKKNKDEINGERVRMVTGLTRGLTEIKNDGVYSGIAWLKACGDNRASTVYPIIVHNSASHNRFI